MDFKIGDTVQLKSGGPLMTVEAADTGEQFICTWMERSGTQSAPKYAKKQDRFLATTLVKAGGARVVGVGSFR